MGAGGGNSHIAAGYSSLVENITSVLLRQELNSQETFLSVGMLSVALTTTMLVRKKSTGLYLSSTLGGDSWTACRRPGMAARGKIHVPNIKHTMLCLHRYGIGLTGIDVSASVQGSCVDWLCFWMPHVSENTPAYEAAGGMHL